MFSVHMLKYKILVVAEKMTQSYKINDILSVLHFFILDFFHQLQTRPKASKCYKIGPASPTDL